MSWSMPDLRPKRKCGGNGKIPGYDEPEPCPNKRNKAMSEKGSGAMEYGGWNEKKYGPQASSTAKGQSTFTRREIGGLMAQEEYTQGSQSAIPTSDCLKDSNELSVQGKSQARGQGTVDEPNPYGIGPQHISKEGLLPMQSNSMSVNGMPAGSETLMRTFTTGATRNLDSNKVDYEGFLSPLTLIAFGRYMNKHRQQADGQLRASDNWQKGIPLDSYIKSLFRHVVTLWLHHRGLGALADEPLEDALGGIMFNANGYTHEVEKARFSPSSPLPKTQG